MKRIVFVLLALCAISYMVCAKEKPGQVAVTLTDGTRVEGYCENLLKHERKAIKISPRPDGKKAVKYKATDIRELCYRAPGDTAAEYWYPVPYCQANTLLMKKVRQLGPVILWIACIGDHELLGAQGMRWVERVKNCVSFGPDMADGAAWDLYRIINGLCKGLPGYSEFVKAYKTSRPDVKDWADPDALLPMCKAYVDSCSANP